MKVTSGNIVYATCENCDEPIVRHNNGRWRHCSNTSRWCGEVFDPDFDFSEDLPVAVVKEVK